MKTPIFTPLQSSDKISRSNIRASHTMVWVTFDRAGMHRYPAAPADVLYLASPHRHKFYFKVGVSVHNDDREIEFHQMLNWLTGLYDTKTLELDYKSCEMMAQEVVDALIGKYDCSSRRLEVTVSEDQECGATIVSKPIN